MMIFFKPDHFEWKILICSACIETSMTYLKFSKLVWSRPNLSETVQTWSKLGQIGPTIFNFSGQNFAEGRKSILEFLLTYMVIIFFRLHDRHLWSAAQTSSDLKLPTESDSDSINDYAGGFVCKYSTLPIAKILSDKNTQAWVSMVFI